MRFVANPLAIYFCIIGMALLFGGLALLVSRIRLAGGEHTQGQIVGYRERMQERGGRKKHYMPLVRFHSRDGSAVEFQSRMGATCKPLQIGEPVPVVYRPDRPDIAEIASASRLWLAPAVMSAMALVALYAAWKAGEPY